jgi:hypothetical protein
MSGGYACFDVTAALGFFLEAVESRALPADLSALVEEVAPRTVVGKRGEVDGRVCSFLG